MQLIDDMDHLARVLPGRWRVVATNFPMWVSGDRSDPVFEYETAKVQPLALTDRVHYRDRADRERLVKGTSTWRGGSFVWRGAGRLFPFRSRWGVSAAEGDVLVIHFDRSLVTPAGIDVLVREGSDVEELRATLSADLGAYGLEPTEFARLTWLDHLPPR